MVAEGYSFILGNTPQERQHESSRTTNLQEQQNLITPVLDLLQDYQIIILGDREFGSVKLAQWLCDVSVKFVLRVKQERYIQGEKSEY